jgi:hypothetical protein
MKNEVATRTDEERKQSKAMWTTDYLEAYSLTPSFRIIPEKLTSSQSRNSPHFTTFTIARHQSLS